MPTRPTPRRVRMDDVTVERVLRVVELVPPGKVAAYGEVGAIAGVGARLVGRIMREWGSGVPWWRITNAAGDHPLLARALPHWEAEGIEVKPNGLGCRMNEYGADLDLLRERAERSFADLSETAREMTKADLADPRSDDSNDRDAASHDKSESSE